MKLPLLVCSGEVVRESLSILSEVLTSLLGQSGWSAGGGKTSLTQINYMLYQCALSYSVTAYYI